jgi:hypothetical protein
MNSNGYKKKTRTMNLWTHSQAQSAAPYLSTILRSIRETWLDAVQKEIFAKRLEAKTGRSDRQRIIAENQARSEAQSALDRYQEAREELEEMGVACLEPNQGVAWIPFAHDNQLAWFVFDVFDSEPIRSWRYQTDPLETRRPLAEIEDNATPVSWTV